MSTLIYSLLDSPAKATSLYLSVTGYHGHWSQRISPHFRNAIRNQHQNPPFTSFSIPPTMAQPSSTASETAPASAVAQQGDNIAHALAGAGGGLLSMTLTSVLPLHFPPAAVLTSSGQLSIDHPLHPCSSRVEARSFLDLRCCPPHCPTRRDLRTLLRIGLGALWH